MRSTPFLFQILIQLDLTLTHLRFSSSSKQLCLCRQASSPRASIEAKLIAANSIGMVSIEYFLIPLQQPSPAKARTKKDVYLTLWDGDSGGIPVDGACGGTRVSDPQSGPQNHFSFVFGFVIGDAPLRAHL
jgi:hypothetical protein